MGKLKNYLPPKETILMIHYYHEIYQEVSYQIWLKNCEMKKLSRKTKKYDILRKSHQNILKITPLIFSYYLLLIKI